MHIQHLSPSVIVGHTSCFIVLSVGLVRIIQFPETKFFGLSEASFYSGSIQSSISQQHLKKTVFCFNKEQGVLVNNECGLWCDRVGNF